MRAIIFDAFGTLFKVSSGGSAKTIMKNITDCGIVLDEKAFLEEWKSYYKKHASDDYIFMTDIMSREMLKTMQILYLQRRSRVKRILKLKTYYMILWRTIWFSLVLIRITMCLNVLCKIIMLPFIKYILLKI